MTNRNSEFYDYMTARQWSNETMDRWELGYFPLNKILDLKVAVAKAGLSVESLESKRVVANYGIKGYTSKFFGRIIFPIRNEFGEYIAITGRAIDGVSQPKYFNTEFEKLNNVFGLNYAIDSIRENDLVYVFEGNADVITAHQNGVTNSVCIMGTAFRENHLILLAGYCSRIVLVFDNDTGGRKALSSFNERHIDRNKDGVKVLASGFFGDECKDADEYIKSKGSKRFLDLMTANISNKDLQRKLRSGV